MTFEQFLATKRPCDDLAAAVQSAPWGDTAARGFLYLDALYIETVETVETVDASWPEETQRAGAYHLLIGRSEWITDNLEELERRLFEFAVSEGYSG